jgi:hypothetical protein
MQSHCKLIYHLIPVIIIFFLTKKKEFIVFFRKMDDGSDFTDTDIDSVLADDECIYDYYYFEIYFILIPNWLDNTQEPLFQSGFNVLFSFAKFLDGRR